MKQYISIALLFATLIFGCSKDDSISQEQNNPINKVFNRQATGSSANDLLSSNAFKSMVIELVYVEGFEPTQTSIDNFVSFLNNRTFKPNGITVEKRVIPSPGKDTFTIEDIADIEKEERENYNSKDKIAVWALFVDGKSENDSGNKVTLGTAYWNTSFVIYEETLKNLSNSPFEPDRSLLETTVINHEFGHILGLTNLGSEMQDEHEDEEHPKHCDVESCLMYWSAETGAGITNMTNMNSAPQLDAQCIADLQANGGK
ncbi:membrane metalloprotease [Algibacter sp. 2305UL17-15]|uniref:membrane metalloprotease n=1 Tax=Algibacter sp. 2305UL17-15 TaxID=3231268 RepID=UPI003459841B